MREQKTEARLAHVRSMTGLTRSASRKARLALLAYCALMVGCVGGIDGEVDDNFGNELVDDAGNVIIGDGGASASDGGAASDAARADGAVVTPALEGGSNQGIDAGSVAQDGSVASDAALGADASSTVDAAGPVDNSVPAGAHCDPVRNWPAEWSAFEQEVLKLTNEARAVGHNCDAKGNFGKTTPLTMHPALRCAARLHSKYMLDNNEFAHDEAKTGLNPFVRMTNAGYNWKSASENIAAGQPTPKSVVDGWLESDGHCANIMSPGSVHLGVGIAIKGAGSTAKYKEYWTQNFGAPR